MQSCRLRCSSKRSGGSVKERSLTQPRTPKGAPTIPSSMSEDGSPLIAYLTSSWQESLCGLFAKGSQQVLDAIRHVRALLQPMLDPRHVEAQLDFGAACNGIEEPDALEAGAALAFAAVGHHNVIERRLLAAASSPTDRHHLLFTLQ